MCNSSGAKDNYLIFLCQIDPQCFAGTLNSMITYKIQIKYPYMNQNDWKLSN